MHRSGTTLLERMLAGHDAIVDCGETYAFPAQLRWVTDHFCAGTADPTLIERTAGAPLEQAGARYVGVASWRARGRPFVTEKLNPNFMLLGQIATSLPEARLVHIRRDAADTCFSNLRTLFTIEAAYSYDQLEVADFYIAYRQLMEHWREILGDRLHHVSYEALVADAEAQARELARYIGIDYTPRMLDVGRAEGMVATASVHDVRRGIQKDRVNAWRPYARFLEPMLERLARHGYFPKEA